MLIPLLLLNYAYVILMTHHRIAGHIDTAEKDHAISRSLRKIGTMVEEQNQHTLELQAFVESLQGQLTEKEHGIVIEKLNDQISSQQEEATEKLAQVRASLNGAIGDASAPKYLGEKEIRKERKGLPWPTPDGWEKLGYKEIRRHFQCNSYNREAKPLPSLEDWQLLQRKYKGVVRNVIFDDPVPPTMGYTLGKEGPPPFHAGHSTGRRGRGLFASRDIRKGELVHDGRHSDISFPDGMAWRRFIFSLPTRKKACDVIDWTWTQNTGKKKLLKIFSAINISVLLNEGDNGDYKKTSGLSTISSKKKYACKNCNVNPRSKASSKFIALRDIKMGEWRYINP